MAALNRRHSVYDSMPYIQNIVPVMQIRKSWTRQSSGEIGCRLVSYTDLRALEETNTIPGIVEKQTKFFESRPLRRQFHSVGSVRPNDSEGRVFKYNASDIYNVPIKTTRKTVHDIPQWSRICSALRQQTFNTNNSIESVIPNDAEEKVCKYNDHYNVSTNATQPTRKTVCNFPQWEQICSALAQQSDSAITDSVKPLDSKDNECKYNASDHYTFPTKVPKIRKTVYDIPWSQISSSVTFHNESNDSDSSESDRTADSGDKVCKYNGEYNFPAVAPNFIRKTVYDFPHFSQIPSSVERPEMKQMYQRHSPIMKQRHQCEPSGMKKLHQLESPEMKQRFQRGNRAMNQRHQWDTPEVNQLHQLDASEMNQRHQWDLSRPPEMVHKYQHNAPEMNQRYEWGTPEMDQRQQWDPPKHPERVQRYQRNPPGMNESYTPPIQKRHNWDDRERHTMQISFNNSNQSDLNVNRSKSEDGPDGREEMENIHGVYFHDNTSSNVPRIIGASAKRFERPYDEDKSEESMYHKLDDEQQIIYLPPKNIPKCQTEKKRLPIPPPRNVSIKSKHLPHQRVKSVKKSSVAVRRSRSTYGVGVLNKFIKEKHPPEKRIIKAGTYWCVDVLDKFVCANEHVPVGRVVTRSYYVMPSQKEVLLHLYATEKSDVIIFVTDKDVRKVGSLHLPLEDQMLEHRQEISVHFHFGGAEVNASAVNRSTGRCDSSNFEFVSL